MWIERAGAISNSGHGQQTGKKQTTREKGRKNKILTACTKNRKTRPLQASEDFRVLKRVVWFFASLLTMARVAPDFMLLSASWEPFFLWNYTAILLCWMWIERAGAISNQMRKPTRESVRKRPAGI
jgi:hypothetical protein